MRSRREIDPPTDRELRAADRSWFIAPPYGWDHPVTGRGGWQPDPLLLAFGQYVKRARYLAGMSQTELSVAAEVDQGAISRLERALAPAMKVERLVRLADAMGRSLPLGYCPHEHYLPLAKGARPRARPTASTDSGRVQVLFGLQPTSASSSSDALPAETEVRHSDASELIGIDISEIRTPHRDGHT